MSVYKSEPRTIAAPQARVFSKLCAMTRPDQLGRLLNEWAKLEVTECENDHCTVKINPVGQVGVRIERTEPGLICFIGDNSPIAFSAYIRITSQDDDSCILEVDLEVALNLFLKKMLDEKLEKAAQKAGKLLCELPY